MTHGLPAPFTPSATFTALEYIFDFPSRASSGGRCKILASFSNAFLMAFRILPCNTTKTTIACAAVNSTNPKQRLWSSSCVIIAESSRAEDCRTHLVGLVSCFPNDHDFESNTETVLQPILTLSSARPDLTANVRPTRSLGYAIFRRCRPLDSNTAALHRSAKFPGASGRCKTKTPTLSGYGWIRATWPAFFPIHWDPVRLDLFKTLDILSLLGAGQLLSKT